MTRGWRIVAALSVTETVSWGILYYAFAVFLTPMHRELGFTTAELAGAFSTALLVSGVAGIAVGRWLDHRSPRPLMTLGSLAGAALVVAWSQVESLAALYAVWIGIGLVMAAVLYEPAFVVVAKWFPEPVRRRRAMTSMTLVGALASFIFLPLSDLLIGAHGWRDALLVLAIVLAAVTVPLHAGVVRRAPAGTAANAVFVPASRALRSTSFWSLSIAFVLASMATIAMTVHTIPLLLERGHDGAFAAFAVGLIGVSQIPGRLLFGPIAARLSTGASNAAVFLMIALGIGLVAGVDSTASALGGLVVLGMGNGMTTLARATSIADRFGTTGYGTIAGVAASMTTAARAIGPVAAALLAAASSYTAMLWTLAALAAGAALLACSPASRTCVDGVRGARERPASQALPS